MNNILNLRRCIMFFLVFILCNPLFAQDRHTVLLYTFENVKGNTISDLSINKNNGKIMGAKLGDGKFRRGMVFGGDQHEDFIEIPDSISLDLIDGLSVEMWLFLNSTSTSGGVGVTKASTYKVGPRNDSNLELRINTTTTAWGAAVFLSQKDLPLNKWVHIAGTYDAKSGDAKLYLNGNLDNEKKIEGQIQPNDSVIWIGRGGTPYLHGSLDDIRISNIARTEKEIQELMEIGIAGVLAVDPKGKLSTNWGQLKASIISY
ncbi:LamG domain-containing protein [Candidatus Poribacteria bacterium]|nr:LamG domain-containing protein [Candidatus Poribacteria bacterium]